VHSRDEYHIIVQFWYQLNCSAVHDVYNESSIRLTPAQSLTVSSRRLVRIIRALYSYETSL